MKKFKLSKDTSEFILTYYTTITQSKLAYKKVTHRLVISGWSGAACWILMNLRTLMKEQNLHWNQFFECSNCTLSKPLQK